MEEKKRRDIQVVTGDTSELKISPVREHLSAIKPKTKEEKEKQTKNIIIPETKKMQIYTDNEPKKMK